MAGPMTAADSCCDPTMLNMVAIFDAIQMCDGTGSILVRVDVRSDNEDWLLNRLERLTKISSETGESANECEPHSSGLIEPSTMSTEQDTSNKENSTPEMKRKEEIPEASEKTLEAISCKIGLISYVRVVGIISRESNGMLVLRSEMREVAQ